MAGIFTRLLLKMTVTKNVSRDQDSTQLPTHCYLMCAISEGLVPPCD